MTREEFSDIQHKYNLRLTGHQIWIGYLYHIANLDAKINDYKIIYFNQSKSDPSKENFEKFVQKYVLKIKEDEIIKRINKMKVDF